MIDKKELRAGNFVNVPHGDVQINYLMVTGAHFMDGCGGTWQSLEPIPLSPEWLIRFGAIFPYDDKLRLELAGLSFYYSQTGLLYLNDSGYNEAISKAVEFVHQLQNLIFSLTGEELTLKN